MDVEDLKVLLTWVGVLGLIFLAILVGAGVLGLATAIYRQIAGF